MSEGKQEAREFKRGDDVFIRGKVMNVYPDEIVVAPYAHRNGGGSVAVRQEDIFAARQANQPQKAHEPFLVGLVKTLRSSSHPEPAVRQQLGHVANLLETYLVSQPQEKAQPESRLATLVEFIGFLSVEYRWPQARIENCVKLAKLFLSRAEPPQGEAEKEGRT